MVNVRCRKWRRGSEEEEVTSAVSRTALTVRGWVTIETSVLIRMVLCHDVGGQRRPKKMKKSRMRGIRGQLHYSDSEDDGGRGGEQQHGQHEADEEEVEDERRDCGRIQLVSGHQLVFTDGDMDTSKQLDMKKRRRKQKKVNKKKRLNAVTMAALKHQEVREYKWKPCDCATINHIY